MTDIARLSEKLIRIEALFAGAATEGERVAAAEARARIHCQRRGAVHVPTPGAGRCSICSSALVAVDMAAPGQLPFADWTIRRTSSAVSSGVSAVLSMTCSVG